jgi:hypothetical protein
MLGNGNEDVRTGKGQPVSISKPEYSKNYIILVYKFFSFRSVTTLLEFSLTCCHYLYLKLSAKIIISADNLS